MICTNWTTFRRRFAVLVEETAGAFTFVNGTPATITRGDAVSFIAQGYLSGHTLSTFGTALNDGQYLIDTVAAATLTLATGETLVAEGPGAATFESGFVDKDEVYRWPIALVRSGGFSGGFTGIPEPLTTIGMTVSCNGTAADAVATVDEYDWYLSQRSDDPASQWWEITQYVSGASTYSGTVKLTMTAAAVTKFTVTISPDDLPALLKNVHLYCRRRSDGAIQWADIYRTTMGV